MAVAELFLAAALLNEAEALSCGPVEMREGRLWTVITVNGTETEALLDSGAELTLLDAAFARQIATERGEQVEARGTGAGSVEAQFLPETRLEVAGRALEPVTAVAIDLSDVSERLIGEPLAGVAGRELFDQARVEIDIEAGTVCVVDRDTPPEGVRFDLVERAGIMSFAAEVEGHAILADFDTGNRGGLLLSHDAAERAGLYDGRAVRTESAGGIGGAIERDVLAIGQLTIGPFTHRDVTASIDPRENEAHANIGLAVLSHYRMTVDFSENALWLQAY